MQAVSVEVFWPFLTERVVRLLNPTNLLLHTLAAQIPFEIAVGLNGRIWFKSPSVSETIALKRVIEGVEDGSIGTERKEVERALKTFLA